MAVKGIKVGKMFKQNIASVANTANKKITKGSHEGKEALGLDNRAILDAFLAFFVLLIGDWIKIS